MKSVGKGIKKRLLPGRHRVKSKSTSDQDSHLICISELRSLIDDDKLFYPSTSSLFSQDGLLTSEKWYFPGINRNQAEIILLSPKLQNHTFLVRISTRPNHYAVSVRSDNKVLHLLIQSDISREKFFLKDNKTFPTIQKLVEHYCHKTKDSYVFLLEEPSKAKLQMKTEFTDSSELSLSLTCSHQTINPLQFEDKEELLVTISSSQETVVSTPLSICAVIDLSDSMEDYLPVMKATLTTLVDQLRPCDKLSIISFANKAKLELDLISINTNGRGQALQVISQLKVWGLTNLSAGIQFAMRVLAKISPNRATPTESILVFTDGEANVGCQSYPDMARNMGEIISKIQTEYMRVCSISRHITASVIAFSTAPPVELKHISDAGNGLYFLIHIEEDTNSIDDLPKAFAKFFGFASTIAAKDIHLNIQADPQIQLCIPQKLPSIYRLRHMTDSQCTIDINDIPAGTTISIGIPIQFKERLDVTTRHCKQLATATMEAYSFVTRKQVLLESAGEVFVDPMRDTIDLEKPEAYLHSLRSEVIQTLDLVYKTANATNYEDAISQVKNMVRNLIEASLSEEEVVQCLVETLLVVLNYLRCPILYMQTGCKILQLLMQAHTQQINNISNTIMIPSDELILDELGVNFELREFIQLSIYEGTGCMAEKVFLSDYANIQPN